MSVRNGRNQRSEFVTNRQLSEKTSFTFACDATKCSIKSGNLSRIIDKGFNCKSEQFWAVPKSLRKSGNVSHVSDVPRETIKSDKRSWKQRLQFIVYCSQVADKFWR